MADNDGGCVKVESRQPSDEIDGEEGWLESLARRGSFD